MKGIHSGVQGAETRLMPGHLKMVIITQKTQHHTWYILNTGIDLDIVSETKHCIINLCALYDPLIA